MENVARHFADAFQTEDIKNAQKQAVPPKTENATKWAIRTWNAWAAQRIISVEEQQFSCITDISAIKIEEMSEQQLIYFIPRFILEVRKKNCEEYSPNSVYQMVCGLQRQIKKKSLQLIYSAPPIQTLDSEMKRLKAKGLGMAVNKAEPISLEEEELLWESGALGDTEAMTLLSTVFYLIGVHFALRSGTEHRRLRFKNSQIELIAAKPEKNEPCKLIYHEDVSKTNQGGLKSRKFPPKTVTYWPRSDKPERCLISLFKKYNSLCPEDRPDDAFYLKPLPVPRANQWYSKAPIGHNILSNIVARLCQRAGIGGHRTNHSLRATAATRLYQSGVDEQLIMEQTGHRSVQGVRSYKRTSTEQQKSVSDVLSGNTVSTCCLSSIKINPLQSLKGFTFNNCSNIQINVQLPQKSK